VAALLRNYATPRGFHFCTGVAALLRNYATPRGFHF
jgi:hypothetical protein